MAFGASALRYPRVPVPPQALDLLVIRVPAFTTGIVIRGPKPPPGMVLGVLAQPRPPVAASGSSGVVDDGSWRCVARCCPVTRQANRSLTPSTRWRWRTAARRRSGLATRC